MMKEKEPSLGYLGEVDRLKVEEGVSFKEYQVT